ncbi:MULE domain-containing protein [Trichonephila clavata]|uniref:MULE domain-containing protein n=1 Tax=Trichonephila clavata TaxID=2740835 RepID=A0A8X6H2P5_TRICU|nr:MULE domain-containing protein [Trichonephila clavata]
MFIDFIVNAIVLKVHDYQLSIDLNGKILKEFNTFSEFETWKEEEENNTMSKYVRQRGSKTHKNGDIVMYYHCCRSGSYKPKGKGLRNLKSQGSVKIGISCPAVMKVIQSTENVVVQYFPKHENHEIQLEQFRLSESDGTAIAGRLKEGVNEKKVFPCISKSADNDGHESKRRKIESILALIDECEFTLEEESKINRNLDSILNICYNKKEHNNKGIKMMESSTINIKKKKIKKQPGNFSTRRKRCTAGTLKNPTAEEVNNIEEGSLLNSQEITSINTDFDYTDCNRNKEFQTEGSYSQFS